MMTGDVPNAFVQTNLPGKHGRIFVKLTGTMLMLLLEIDEDNQQLLRFATQFLDTASCHLGSKRLLGSGETPPFTRSTISIPRGA